MINNISVDCVILGFDSNNLNVLLIEREFVDKSGKELIKDHTLPGYHVKRDENLLNSAERILKEFTGLEDVHLEQFASFGDIDRISKEKDKLWVKSLDFEVDDRVITVAYYSLIDNTKVKLSISDRKANWFPVTNLPELGFDHKAIIEKAISHVRLSAVIRPILFELLPEKFTITELQKIYEAVLSTKLDRRNFRKKVSQMKFIIALNEKQKGVAHKPAQLYFFSKEVYERVKKSRYVINF